MDGDGWMSLSMRSPSSECFQLDERGTQRKQYSLEVATREIEIAIAWEDNVTRPELCRDRRLPARTAGAFMPSGVSI